MSCGSWWNSAYVLPAWFVIKWIACGSCGQGINRNSFSGSSRNARPFSGPAHGDVSRTIPTWTGAKPVSVPLPHGDAPSSLPALPCWDRFSIRLGAVSPCRTQFHLVWRGGPCQGWHFSGANRMAARVLGSLLDVDGCTKPRSARPAATASRWLVTSGVFPNLGEAAMAVWSSGLGGETSARRTT